MIGRDAAKGLIAGLAALALFAAPASSAEGATALPGLACDALSAGPGSAALLSAADPALDAPGTDAAYRRALRAGPQLRAAQPARATAPVRIPVYVHVIREDDTTGNVSDAAIAQQLAVLNAGFAGTIGPGGENTGFVFDLVDTDRSNRPDDYPTRFDDDAELKQDLREGGHRALNVYITDIAPDGVSGVATTPDLPESNRALDGVLIDNQTLPGGPVPERNEGDTLTHEAGHWLGLFHTFEGGCDPQNDLVADTPAHSGATNGCPADPDTCPGEGLDPIHNFMNYSSDACVYAFTPGQADRMHDQTAIYRNDPPQAAAGPLEAASGADASVAVTATDPEGDAVSFRVAEGPDHGTAGGAGPSFTYRSNTGYSGPDAFTVEAVDVFGATDRVEVPVNVQPDEDVFLSARTKTRQKVRKLATRAGCRGEECDLRAKAKIKAKPQGGGKPRRFKTKTARARSSGDGLTKLALVLRPSKRRALEGLLAEGGSATADISVFARDAAGNTSSAGFQVALK